ncbi:MAG: hypothetical protein FWE35_18915 [Streptosporangiales bacterium]|jgi:hypothetical protein|nr:hypothetical protein [Streptosporangiales bacterium]
MTGRGDELHPPSKWKVVARDRTAATGWRDLAVQAPENLRRAWIALTSDPRSSADLSRQHRLKRDLKQVKIAGAELEQWQFEVTGGGRIWYAIDDDRKTLWVTHAGPGHPRRTDR